jgi:hypothetical protein
MKKTERGMHAHKVSGKEGHGLGSFDGAQATIEVQVHISSIVMTAEHAAVEFQGTASAPKPAQELSAAQSEGDLSGAVEVYKTRVVYRFMGDSASPEQGQDRCADDEGGGDGDDQFDSPRSIMSSHRWLLR